MSRPLLKCDKISFSIGSRVLFHDLEFEIRSGERWALVGESGAGKSTLIRVLTGEIPCPKGSIERHSDFSEVPQELSLSEGLSAEASIAVGEAFRFAWWQTLFSLPKASTSHASRLCEVLDISKIKSLEVQNLSGGERQRVAIGRALIQQRDLLIADEPVSRLDHDLGVRIMDIMSDQMKTRRGALFCSLHQRHLVEIFATHILEISSKFPKGWNITERASVS